MSLCVILWYLGLRTYLGRLSFLEANSSEKTEGLDVQPVYSKVRAIPKGVC